MPGSGVIQVERELCETKKEVLRVRRSCNKSATISLCFRVVDLYTVHDLSMPSAHRSFQLIVSFSHFSCEVFKQRPDAIYFRLIEHSWCT